jgi:ElaB/YqjD/DUF883 family membrane-anchored ribosome-binding protein
MSKETPGEEVPIKSEGDKFGEVKSLMDQSANLLVEIIKAKGGEHEEEVRKRVAPELDRLRKEMDALMKKIVGEK